MHLNTLQKINYAIVTLLFNIQKMKKIIFLLGAFILLQSSLYAQCPAPIVPPADAVNVISNPGFESGLLAPSNAGTHTLLASGNSFPGTYKIGGTSTSFNVGLIPGIVPHTGSNMLMIDNVLAANAIAWEQTVTVQPNRTYYFSAWLTALSSAEKSQMVFQVVPVLPVAGATVNISTSFIPPNGPTWKQEFGTWFSGTTTSVTIRLINNNPLAVGGGGNDYAIDDILFRPTCSGVSAGPKPEFGAATLGLCNMGGTADLNSNIATNVNHTYTWFKDGSLVANPFTPDILEGQTAIGTYVVCLDSAGCVKSDTVTLVSPLAINLGPDANLCNPAFKLLDTRITAPASFTIQWYRDNVLIVGQSAPTYMATGAGTYRVEVTDGASCNGSDEIIITSQVDETVGDVICIAQSDDAATVSVVDVGGIYNWYDAPTGGNLLASGLTYSTTGLSGPVTFYVENSKPQNSGAGLPSASSPYLTGSSSGANNVHGQNLMNFKASIDATIDFVDVFMFFNGNAAGNVTITLIDKTVPATTINTFAISNVAGSGNKSYTIPIGLPIVAGHSYEFSITGINGQFGTLRYADGGIPIYFPSTNQAVVMTGGQAPSIYPGLFNWIFSHPSACVRTPAAVTEFCVVPPCIPPTSVSLTIIPNTTTLCRGANLTIRGVVDTSGLTPLYGSYYFTWYKNGTAISTPTNVYADLVLSNIIPTDAGSYKLEVEDFNTVRQPGCFKAATVPIIVNDSIGAGTIAANQVICIGNTASAFTSTLPASGGSGAAPVYQWESSINGVSNWSSIAGATSATYSAGAVTTTTYYKRKVLIGAACPQDSSNIVSITVNPVLTANTISSSQSICSGAVPSPLTETVAPTGGTGTYTYQWQTSLNGTTGWTNATGVSTNNSYAPASLTNTLHYRLVVSSGTCSTVNSNPVTITIPTTSVPTISINPVAAICVGTTVNFSTVHALEGTTPTYQWYLNGTPVGTNIDTYSNSTLVNGDIVYVEMTSSLACASPTMATSAQVTMVVKPIPTPQIVGKDTTFCSGVKVIFSSIVGTGTLKWKNNGVAILGATNASLVLTKSGTYTLEESNGTCAATSAPFTVTVLSTPIANAGPDQTVNDGTVVMLSGSGGSSYSWSPASVLNNSLIASPTFTSKETETFVLTVSDPTSGCSSTDQVTVFVFKNIIVPNAITPNGDGNNETWEIKNLKSFTNCSVEIFNRWGTLVWKSTGYAEEWDGSNYRNGGLLPDGTYFYIINLNSDLSSTPYTGYVQIVK